ncbi:MAG: hypothetical protein R3B96_15240 [Pirellulaceae bacterium]
MSGKEADSMKFNAQWFDGTLGMVQRTVKSACFLLAMNCLSVAWSPAPSIAQESESEPSERVRLEYRFTEGEQVRFLTEHLATTLTRISTIESPGRSRTETIKVWRIQEVREDGSIVFEQSIERLVLSQLVGEGNEIRYDSRSSDAPPLRYESISKTIGVPLVLVTISATGEVLEKEAIYDEFQMGLDDVAMPLPGQPIAVGEQWFSPTTFTADDKGLRVYVDLCKVYTLLRVENGIATIGMKNEVLTLKSSRESNPN